MRLVFLYHAQNQAAPGSGSVINLSIPATNKFATRVKEEGYFYLLQKMLNAKVVDEILLIIESNLGKGFIKYQDKFTGWVIPEIQLLLEHLRPGDVIWVRGGHRTTHDFLVKAGEKGHWRMIYAANTGRQRWPFWDVVLDDLRKPFCEVDSNGRLWIPWKKPTNPNLFKPINTKRVYDLCIGASFIHDKKGQWRVIEVLSTYKKIFGKNLKCILPGAPRRGVHSNNITGMVSNDALDVKFAGGVPREELCKIFNQSRLFIHLGTSGQNDRGPLEAMCCGTPVALGSPAYHAPMVYDNNINFVVPDLNDFEGTARFLHKILPQCTEEKRKEVKDYYESQANVDRVILPDMKRLFSIFRENPIANKEKLLSEYIRKEE